MASSISGFKLYYLLQKKQCKHELKKTSVLLINAKYRRKVCSYEYIESSRQLAELTPIDVQETQKNPRKQEQIKNFRCAP